MIYHPVTGQDQRLYPFFAAYGTCEPTTIIGQNNCELVHATYPRVPGTRRQQAPDWIVTFECPNIGPDWTLRIKSQDGVVLYEQGPFEIIPEPVEGYEPPRLKIRYPVNGGTYKRSHLVAYGSISHNVDQQVPPGTFAGTINHVLSAPPRFVVQFKQINGPSPITINLQTILPPNETNPGKDVVRVNIT